jgi:inner membrane protein
MKTSPMMRLLIMGVILLALNVPLTMMCGVVGERAARREAVVNEVSGTWGGAQTIGGPVLSVPYRCSWTDGAGRVQSATSSYHFLPEALEIDGVIDPGERKRSLFTVVVYTATLKVRGRFAPPRIPDVTPVAEAILWDDASVSLGVSDPRGIARAIDLTWNGQRQRFVPGSARIGLFQSRVQAPAPGMTADRADPYTFELDVEVKGTRELRILPAGDETVVRLTSSWPHPSFVGTAPDPPRIDANGFAASWRVPYFGRGFAQQWKADNQQVDDELARQASAASFGVALVQPVDIYVQTERAVKYAVLFIVMTFVIAFAWEIAGGVLVHPIQYLFVGFTMCIFYLLLLSLAEHRGFDVAYVVATSATVLLLSWYWSWVLGGRRQGVLMGAAMTTLYGYLYLLLRLEDYALLAGSVGLFVMLALVMFLTRRVNWYELRLGERAAAGQQS